MADLPARVRAAEGDIIEIAIVLFPIPCLFDGYLFLRRTRLGWNSHFRLWGVRKEHV
jgi:hypothetical protein